MKAILEFELPEETIDFDYARNGIKFKVLIDELLNELRNRRKYQDQTLIQIKDIETFIFDRLPDVD